LDQARLRGARDWHHRRIDAEAINLGNEPPLSVDGGAGGLVDRRRLSVQWFSGTILTGLCGAALMGGAVFASLDGETNFASAPEQVESALRGAISSIGEHLNALRKTDRLPAITEASVARQVLRVPTSSRVRDREMVRMRPFVRVTGNLMLTTSDLSAKIPPYNPQKLLTDSVGGDDQAPAAEPDAEVSFVECDLVAPITKNKVATPGVCDLNSLLSKVKASTQLPLDDVMARVRDTALHTNTGTTASLLVNADGTPNLKMSYAPEADPDTYFGFVPRAVPENVTLLPKTTSIANGGGDWSEKQIVVKKGETVGSILREIGAAPEEIKAIIAVIGPAALDGGLKDGQKLRILMTPAGLGHTQPLRVIISGDSGITAAVALSDVGRYVPVDIRNIDTGVADSSTDEQANAGDDDSSGVQLYQSLYETALRNNVPNSVIEDLVRIYSYDVDFERKVQPGDSFDVLYADDETGDRPEVRYASLTVGGETKKYYRFQTTDDGVYDYYDETGKSAKKFLVRKPVAVGMVTSPFGWRTHPLLHVSELHSGVDWGAPYGTPIFAAGNGEIEEIGLKGGYGKYVRIKHANGYETAYGHMTAFAKGLDVGSKVRQGQVIGFVGSSGMSTGSHVHFEIIVNDRFVDPMRIKLPRGRVLDGGTLAGFEKDRDQLDAVLSHAPVSPAHVAQAH
jgi:murein DD-endopeptidase MepM/ murein hydrolase activator NlpD